jgi:CheY-like chemotaxis protein
VTLFRPPGNTAVVGYEEVTDENLASGPQKPRALAAGYQTHIAKPATPTELIVTVATVAGRAPA